MQILFPFFGQKNVFGGFYNETTSFSHPNAPTHVQTNQRLMQRVFAWMFVGLSMTAIIAFVLSLNPNVPKFLAANPLVFYGIIGLELLTLLDFIPD